MVPRLDFWRFGPQLTALAAGALAALAFEPFGFLPGLFGWTLLVLAIEGARSPRGAFAAGWCAGFGYFLVGCFWVAEAFLVDAEAHGWMAPFAAAGLPTLLGLFWGAAAFVYWRFGPAHAGRGFFFAAVFAIAERLRGMILTGFPWNPPGSVWEAGSAPSQVAAWVGAYGLSFLTIAGFAALAPLLLDGERKRRFGAAALGALIVVGLFVAGAVRLAGARVRETTTVVRVVQPDVDQATKWDEGTFDRIASRYVSLTAAPPKTPRAPDVVVWPEGALPALADQYLASGHWVGPALVNATRPGQTLIIGASRIGDRPGVYHNSLIVMVREAEGLRITETYDKHRLVPFGEYLPFGLERFDALKALIHVGDGFTPGPRPAPIDLPGAPRVQPLICYESLYPGFTSEAGGRPQWIVNASNDAWFGRGSGPVQHLNLASYRAIEEGLPIVRATPTGVSGVIDPYGRVLGDARLDVGESGVVDARLPAPLRPTLFSLVGDFVFWLMVAIAMAGTLWRPRAKAIDHS